MSSTNFQPIYSGQTIEEISRKLFQRANNLVWSDTFFGAMTSVIVGGFVYNSGIFPILRGIDINLVLLVSLIIGLLNGYFKGQGRALQLKLEAQLALCQVEIERKTVKGNSDLDKTGTLT